MKIILEFASWEEHDQYVASYDARQEGNEQLTIRPDGTRRVPASTRRRGFSESEMSFVTDHYATKTVPWIARQLFTKPTQIQALVQKMRKAGGLPRKYARCNGEVREAA